MFVKSLQRLTPKLNLQETEEVDVETLKDKDEEFDIAAAFKVDFEEDDSPEESPGKVKKFDESMASPSKKFTGTETAVLKDGFVKQSTIQATNPKDAVIDPVPAPDLLDKDMSVKSGSRKLCLTVREAYQSCGG